MVENIFHTIMIKLTDFLMCKQSLDINHNRASFLYLLKTLFKRKYHLKRNFMKVILVMNRFYNYYDNGDLFLKIFYEKAQLLFENPFLWNLKISPWKKLYVLTLFYCYYGRLRELDIVWIIWSMHFFIFIISVLSPTWISFVKKCWCVFLIKYL